MLDGRSVKHTVVYGLGKLTRAERIWIRVLLQRRRRVQIFCRSLCESWRFNVQRSGMVFYRGITGLEYIRLSGRQKGRRRFLSRPWNPLAPLFYRQCLFRIYIKLHNWLSPEQLRNWANDSVLFAFGRTFALRSLNYSMGIRLWYKLFNRRPCVLSRDFCQRFRQQQKRSQSPELNPAGRSDMGRLPREIPIIQLWLQ